MSGTASIDAQGETFHVGNIDKQIHETFNVISTLIQDANMDMQCWMEGVVFFKNPAYVQEYLDAIEQNERAALPVILCVADICRDDLLFEIDGVFAKKGE